METVKICIAGKNDIAVDVLLYIIENKIYEKNEVNIICNRTEDGKNKWQKSLRFFANRLGIKEITLEAAYSLDKVIFLSLEFDRIINPDLFHTKYLYNIHFSLLPRYKGMYTAVMPLLMQDDVSGVTFHRIDKGIDTGEIVEQVKFDIHSTDTARDVYCRCLEYGRKLVIKEILKMKQIGWLLPNKRQEKRKSKYYSSSAIDFSNIIIDVNQTADYIISQIHAYSFREYQIPTVHGKKIIGGEILDISSCGKKPGTVLWHNDDMLLISSIDYDVVLYIDRFDDVMKYSREGNIEVLRGIAHLSMYMNQQGDNGWTPLMVATYFGYVDIAMMFIALGAEITKKNWNGTNLLMYAKDGWKRTGDKSLFSYFLKHGISVDACDYEGVSLRDYCKNDNIDINTLMS